MNSGSRSDDLLRRVQRVSAMAALVLLLAVSPARATIYTWNVAAGGLTNTSVNWSPSGVPGANDDTRFFQTVTYTITMASPADTFATVWAGSSGGHPQFSCSDALRVRNYFNVDGGATASVISGFARAGWFTVGVGSLTITGTGTEAAATNPTASTYIGTASGFTSTMSVSGGAGFTAPLIYVPEFNNITGILNVAGHPNLGSGSNLHVIAVNGAPNSGVIYIGNQGVGDLELSNGGNVTVDSYVELGPNATGKLHLFRNSILVPLPTLFASLMYIGQNNTSTAGGQGTFAIDQGLARVNEIHIGDDDGGSADTLRMTGGTLWVPGGLMMNTTNTGILDLRGGTLALDSPLSSTIGVGIRQSTPLTISGTSPTVTIYAGGQGGFDIPATSITTTSPLSLYLGRDGGGTLRAIGDGFQDSRDLEISGGVVMADSPSGTGTLVVDTAAVVGIGGGLTVGPGNGVIQIRRQAAIGLNGEADFVGGTSTGASVLVSDTLSEGLFRNGLNIGGTAVAAVPGLATVTADSSAELIAGGPPLRVWKGGGRLVLKTRSQCFADSVRCSGEVQMSAGTLAINPIGSGPINVFDTGSIHGVGVVQGRLHLTDATATLSILGTDPASGTLKAGDSTAADGFTSAGTVDVEQDTLVILNHGQAPLGHVVLNGGTLRLPQGGHLRATDLLEGTAGRIEGELLDDGVINPSGAIDVAGHVTCLAGAINGSYLNVVLGGELSVKGTQSGVLRIGGQLDMGPAPSLLNLSSTLTLLSTGAVTMRIGSKASQVQDTLTLSHGLTLNGTLDLRTWKPAPPMAGDTLTLLTAPSISGTFAAVTIDGVNAPAYVQPIYSTTSVKVAILQSTADVPPAPPANSALPLRFAAVGPPSDIMLELDLPTASSARVSLYDIGGRRVATLSDGLLAAGPHRFALRAADLPSGIYFGLARIGGSQEGRVLLARVVKIR